MDNIVHENRIWVSEQCVIMIMQYKSLNVAKYSEGETKVLVHIGGYYVYMNFLNFMLMFTYFPGVTRVENCNRQHRHAFHHWMSSQFLINSGYMIPHTVGSIIKYMPVADAKYTLDYRHLGLQNNLFYYDTPGSTTRSITKMQTNVTFTEIL